MLLNLLHPLLYGIEGRFIINRIDEDNTLSTFIIRLSDCPEPFLASGVPDLHFNFFLFNLDGFQLEVNANGGQVVVGEAVFAEPHK